MAQRCIVSGQNGELDVVDPMEALLPIGALASVITNLKPEST